MVSRDSTRRFSPSSEVVKFTESLEADYRLYPYDIEASIVWGEALANAGAITRSEFEEIRNVLREIESELEDGTLELDPELEDIHMNVESELIERCGDTGAKIHFGRSRNDQVLVDVKLYLKDVLKSFSSQLIEVLRVLLERAEAHQETYLPGYTHLQPAQPIRLAHYLLAYFEKFRRDYGRLRDALESVDVLPLGSAALAGSGVKVDREFIARELGFAQTSNNSLDAVSERDFMIDCLGAFAQLGVHASRLCEDWIFWSNPSFDFCQLGEEFTTGSSIMPQKINPDVAELIRAQTGRLNGSLQGLLTVLKAQPLAYNRDLQEDKIHLFRAIDCLNDWLPLLDSMIEKTEFDPDAMNEALKEGYPEATDLADYLVEKGVPFREAHSLVRKTVEKAMKQDKRLPELSIDDYQEVDSRFDPSIYKLMSADKSTRRRDLPGGTGPTSVNQQFDRARSWLNDHA